MTPSQGQDLQEGVYRTPMDLLRPVDFRWRIVFDLAADSSNCAAMRLGRTDRLRHFTEGDDALTESWEPSRLGLAVGEFAWLNPPYGNIGAWTEKAEQEAAKGARVVMLLPSATGASWLLPCREKAQIVFLIGRPVFEFINPMDHKNPAKRGKPNTDPYGKDLLLAVFGQGTGVSWWNWRR